MPENSLRKLNFLTFSHSSASFKDISVFPLTSLWYLIILFGDFPGGSDGKTSACNVEDPGLIPGSGRSLGEGNGNPLQYSCLENSMDRGAWWATVHEVAKSWTRLSDFTFTFFQGIFCCVVWPSQCSDFSCVTRGCNFVGSVIVVQGSGVHAQ